MSGSARRTAARIAVLGLALALLAYVLHTIGWAEVARYLGRIGPLAALGLVAAGYLENGFDAAALRVGLGPRAGRARTLFVSQAGAFLNMFVPFDGGELFKATMLRRLVGGRGAIAGVVLWNYLAKLTKSVAVLLASGAAWLLAGTDGARSTALALVLLSVASFSMFLGFRLAIALGATERIARLLVRLRLLRRAPEELVAKAAEIDATVRSFSKERRGASAAAFGYQMAARAVNFLTLWFLVSTLGGQGLEAALVAYATFGLATFITLLLPNRIGVDEGAGYVVFGLVGLDPALGAMLQFVVRLRNAAVNGVALPIALGTAPGGGAGEKAE